MLCSGIFWVISLILGGLATLLQFTGTVAFGPCAGPGAIFFQLAIPGSFLSGAVLLLLAFIRRSFDRIRAVRMDRR